MTIEELKASIKNLDGDEAIVKITEYLRENPRDDEALTLRGMKYFGASKRALAINDFLAAIKINPESKAKEALQGVNEILDFYNKDLYNP